MPVFNGLYYAEPPPPPVRQPGLFDAAVGPMPFPAPQAVGGGVQYIPDSCGDVYIWDMQCPPVSGSKTFQPLSSPVSGAPFGVYTSYTCSIVGMDYDEARRRVLTRMQLRLQRAAEKRLWQGGNAPGLPGITGLLRGATALTAASCPSVAMATLEQGLSDNTVVGGIIHARPYMAPLLKKARAIVPGRLPNTWQSVIGTPVVFGQGYDGTGPDGTAVSSTVEYMYATGRVVIWQDSEVWVPPESVINRTDNTLSLVAETVLAMTIECGKWSVAVTRDCTTS
jgi:hypothetical protein